MRSRPWACLVRIVCFTLATAIAVWATAVPLPAASRPAARARHAMVAGPEPLAVTEGLKVLREGGNAVDAAVTIGFVLAVTLPQAGNIGGGGYMLIRMASGETVFVDYRETAPATT
ncbi:MAG: gamma-glutamyltransferase, partial [Acidobacteriota bacterium]